MLQLGYLLLKSRDDVACVKKDQKEVTDQHEATEVSLFPLRDHLGWPRSSWVDWDLVLTMF